MILILYPLTQKKIIDIVYSIGGGRGTKYSVIISDKQHFLEIMSKYYWVNIGNIWDCCSMLWQILWHCVVQCFDRYVCSTLICWWITKRFASSSLYWSSAGCNRDSSTPISTWYEIFCEPHLHGNIREMNSWLLLVFLFFSIFRFLFLTTA